MQLFSPRLRGPLNLCALFFFFAALGLAGQEGADPATTPPPAATAPPAATVQPSDLPASEGGSEDLVRQTLALDIATSSYYELAEWAVSLGLSSSGGAEELRPRLYAHFKLEPPAAAKTTGSVVRIEQAGEASYFNVEEEEGGILRMSGGVQLSLVEASGTSHRIQARRIVYNKQRNALSARGAVHYERRIGSSLEIFTGEALSVDLNNWSGVFLDGKLRLAGAAAKEGDRGTFISAETMVKRTGDVMILEQGFITACDEGDPHYSIRAKKIWILGENEWAVTNAVFSVGHVPLIWLPFFYYPGDEIVFHPVLGYRSREGSFIQTTTYLIGAKPPADKTKGTASSILSLTGRGKDESGPLSLHGLFLRREKGPPPRDRGTLKLMLDAYSGLGGYVGLAGSFPGMGVSERLSFSAGLGFSRSLFPVGSGQYSPYVAAGDWRSQWNYSDLFGEVFPLRFGFNIDGSLRFGPVSISYALPFFTDTCFDQDYGWRSEDMDWFKILSRKVEGTAPARRSSLAQRVMLSASFSIPKISPWLSTLNISRLGLSANWLSKSALRPEIPAYLNSYDPSRDFFYPNQLRLLDVALGFGGRLFSYPARQAPSPRSAAGQAGSGGEPVPDPAAKARSPWAESEEAATKTAQDADNAPKTDAALSESAKLDPAAFRLPARLPSPGGTAIADPWSASIDWNFSPSAFIDKYFRSREWLRPADMNGDLFYNLYSYQLSASLSAAASYRRDLVSASLGFSWSQQEQFRTELYDQGVYAGEAASYRLADLAYRGKKLAGTFRLSSHPLSFFWLWAPTVLSYSFDALLFAQYYRNPDYVEQTFGWDEQSVTAHNAGFTLAIQPWGLVQSFGLTMSLPPRSESYAMELKLDSGPVDLVLRERITRASAALDYKYEPLSIGLRLKQPRWPSLSNTYVHDVENNWPLSNSTTFSWGPVSASLNARRSYPYLLVMGSGWVPDIPAGESFQISDMSLVYSQKFEFGKDKKTSWYLSPALSFSQNVVRFTESNLGFKLETGVTVKKFLDLSFGIESQNSAVWRYYAALFPALDAIGGSDAYQVSFFKDLWDSLSIWDEDALHRSQFKLKSLFLKFKHDLHDWDLSAELKVLPIMKPETKTYVLDFSISILLAWRDISEIVTDIKAGQDRLTY